MISFRSATTALLFTIGVSNSNAQSLPEIADFAQRICGDIPEGSYTKTAIAGKVEANLGALGKLVGGGGNLSVDQQREIYKGIPFDRLPKEIPTMSQCKSALVQIILARHADATCRRPDFGQAGWNRSEDYTDSSDRVDGGHDQTWWCDQTAARFIQSRSIGSLHEIQRLSSHEESHKDWKGHVEYKYHCTIRVFWDPIYNERQSPLCNKS